MLSQSLLNQSKREEYLHLVLPNEFITRSQEQRLDSQPLELGSIEPLLDAFYHNERLYVVSPYIEQGYKDLYRLAHHRQSFAESGIG